MVVGRFAEAKTIADFLTSLTDGPCALMLDGEPGIGKTRLWDAALVQAQTQSRRCPMP